MTNKYAAFDADQYDTLIEKTIPFYHDIHWQVIDVVRNCGHPVSSWLDVGSGTGSLIKKADKVLHNCHFILSDVSDEMNHIARERLKNSEDNTFEFIRQSTIYPENRKKVDVVTCIQVLHYMKTEERKKILKNCYERLNPGGLFISVDNTRTDQIENEIFVLERWKQYQIRHGKSEQEAENHIARYGKDYFPLSRYQQKELMIEAGFRDTGVFWVSYLQSGIYAFKR